MTSRNLQVKILWHPESPGEKVAVVRSWWQRLIYPKDFATLGEVIKEYEYEKAFRLKEMQ